MRSYTQDPDPPAGVLDGRQHVQADTAQGDSLEEVAGKQRIGLGAEEPGVDPGLPEDLPHVRGGDPDLQDEQFAVDGR